jgi:6-phosphofructokinase
MARWVRVCVEQQQSFMLQVYRRFHFRDMAPSHVQRGLGHTQSPSPCRRVAAYLIGRQASASMRSAMLSAPPLMLSFTSKKISNGLAVCGHRNRKCSCLLKAPFDKVPFAV